MTVFGIRHHGPGCARSLRAALEELRPDAVVMEGPADAEAVLPLAAQATMRPPVALLIYPPDEPRRAVYYPFTEFSPEWQTLLWTAQHGVPLRLMDLPQTHQLAMLAATETPDLVQKETPDTEAVASDESPAPTAGDHEEPVGDDAPTPPAWRVDPIGVLAQAAGYRDRELWWEEQIERRADATGLFAAILEAMRTVREELPETGDRDLLREAFMRTTIRAVQKEGYRNIAVICGAWHAPVLDHEALAGKRDGCKVGEDKARLKGLPKVKTVATWIPWTHTRLTYRSGYGAGVHSPGWYAHLWRYSHAVATRWIAIAARLLRERDLDASSASVIEAIRLADALAALRELRSPGLTELNEAIQTVLCHGEPAPMRLIRDRLEVGDVLGEVPEQTPAVPLARDVAQSQKSLRLPPSSSHKLLDLDVRKPNDLARSYLLHRLDLLGIGWGEHQVSGGRSSTFHEVWQIEWKPEFAVAIIEANIWGNTVEVAATSKVIDAANGSGDLAQITRLLDAAVLAGLADAVEPLLSRIQVTAAVGADVRHLMDALPPLARLARYGDVRGTQSDRIEPILVSLFERAAVGLVSACAALDDDAATRMLESIGHVSQALDLLRRDDLQAEWTATLRRLMDRDVHPLLRGWCCRLLLETGEVADDELYRRARLALSPAVRPADCAAWATGLLRGSGLVLLHQAGIWQVFDRWLGELPEETFIEMLPLLRRAFADFTGPERRQMGEKVKGLRTVNGPDGNSPASQASAADNIDTERAQRVLPVLAQILGSS